MFGLVLFSPNFASATTWSASLDDNLLAYISMNETSGTMIDSVLGIYNVTEDSLSIPSMNGKFDKARNLVLVMVLEFTEI
jgi:hypothetical protein